MKKLQLDEIVEKLQLGSIFGDTNTYFQKDNYELVDISLEYIGKVEEALNEDEDNSFDALEEALDIHNYSDWEQEEIRLAINLKVNPENYVEFITISNDENYRMMKEFTNVIVDKKYNEELAKLLDQGGSYKAFKNTLNILKLDEKWNDYRELALKQRAIFWCLKNGIDFEE